MADQFRHHNAGKRDFHREQELEDVLRQSSITIQRSFIESEPSAATKLDAADRAVAIADALERLPEDYRSVIILREFESLAFEDVAERMQRSSGAVRMLWVRALERLRKEMEATL